MIESWRWGFDLYEVEQSTLQALSRNNAIVRALNDNEQTELLRWEHGGY